MRLQPADPHAVDIAGDGAHRRRRSGCAPICPAASTTTRRTGSSIWPPAAAHCSTSASTRQLRPGCSSAAPDTVQTIGALAPTGADLTAAHAVGLRRRPVRPDRTAAPPAAARSTALITGTEGWISVERGCIAPAPATGGRRRRRRGDHRVATDPRQRLPGTGRRGGRGACGPASWRARSSRSTTRSPS